MLNRVITRTSVLAIAATLALTGVASAKAGDKSFQQTYPYASALCAKVDSGHTPPKLKPSEAQIKQACTTLQNGFGPLQAAVQSANAQFTTAVANARAATQAACAKGQPRPHCRQVRRQERLTIMTLRQQHRAAVRLYFTSIEANRRTFWSTIRSLRGGSTVKPDKPIAPQSS